MTIDRTSWWWQKGRAFLVIFGALLLAGWISALLQDDAWEAVRSRQPELKLPDLGDNVSQGMILGLLGGYRSITADFVWLRGYTAWENRDWAETESLFTLGTTLEPMSAYFWDDAANKIAYDIPVWRTRALGPQWTQQAQDAIYLDQANRALAMLNRGLQFHPQNVKLLIDKAQIYSKMNDFLRAAEQYQLASAADPNSPSYLARLAVRMFQKINRDREAYDYFCKVYTHLSPEIPVADKAADWEIILELEETLKLPVAERLPDTDAPAGWKPGDDPNSI